MKTYLIFLFATILAASAIKQTFEGYKVYKIIPRTQDEVDVVKDLQKNGIGQLWDDQVHINYEARIMVPPNKIDDFKNEMVRTNIGTEELISDMQRVIDDQLQPVKRNSRTGSSFLDMTWDRYHNLDEIYKWLDDVAASYPNIVKTVVMGRSFENREIKGIVINYKPDRKDKVIGMLEGTLHAREWISPATVTWIVKEFLTSSDPAVRSLAEDIEWHVFPVVNPDGYVYTFTHNRMWRKNRGTRNFTSCASSGVADDLSNGVDLNRNFDFVWMSTGASDNPCSTTFAGLAPASEPETVAIVNYVKNINGQGKFIYYYSFHSFTQLIVVPYSNVTGVDILTAENYGDMFEIAARGAAKLRQRFGTVYRYGVAHDTLYVMSGTSFDWVKLETNVPVSYLIELRDLGEYGFLLPAEQIIPNNLEIMDALVEMDRVTRLMGYYSGSVPVICTLSVVALCAVVSLLM
ncbi:zinc carboxypeptidase-like [Zerene cesonia]|uniref:zinc carboxypeptidase-like n=1 Tax=Zerene cesonia TaxID=33412 RepID=UPI0018E52739|nr:zinc carboxypeptidase-like [Zerene cesonia]